MIDVNGPARVIMQLASRDVLSYSVDDVMGIGSLNLVPVSLPVKLFSKGFSSGSYDRVCMDDKGDFIYVFIWNTPIQASKDAIRYYNSIDFTTETIDFASNNGSKNFDYFFDNVDCRVPMVTIDALEKIKHRFHQEIRRMIHESHDTNALNLELEAFLLRDERQQLDQEVVVYGISFDTVPLNENQVSDLFATHIENNFDQFKVFREHYGASNMYSPFFQSRTDLCILRNRPTVGGEEAVEGAAISFHVDNDDSNFDDSNFDGGLSIESEMVSKDNGKFQMLANMEMTAAYIADRKLRSESHRIDSIRVIGALLDYKLKKGTIYKLTLDFTRNRSSVTQSQEIQSISRVMEYVFNSI